MKTGINPLDLARAAPRCGAHSRRSGQPCKCPAMRGRKRCRMHGGKAGRPPTHGHWMAAARAERRRLRELLRSLRELVSK